MINEFEIREVLGVRGKEVTERITVVELRDATGVRVEMGTGALIKSVDITTDSARRLAQQLNRIAKRVEARST